jgi:23S rRNA pseudouridine1911/1915/1917 synthase
MDVDRLLELEEDVAFRVNAVEAGKRLDRVVAERVPWATRTAVTAWIRAGRARVDGAPVARAGRIVHAGQQVDVRVVKTRRDLDAPIEDLLAIPIVYRGRDFVIADKPHGVASHPGGGVLKRTMLTALAVALRGQYEPGGPWLPHRLDRETAGLSIVALERAAMVRFSEAFAAGRVRRLYSARVRGRLEPTPEWIDLRFGLRELAHRPKRMAIDPSGLPAHTRLRALESDGTTTRVRLEAVTGRQHQLRLHLSHVGHAILGDPLYDPQSRPGERLELVADALLLPAEVCLEVAPRTIRLER